MSTDNEWTGGIEVNGDGIIRGTIGGSDGTFSGTFAAGNINAVSHINIRDGAVSSYYLFDMPNLPDGESFTIPAPLEQALLLITAPLSIYTALQSTLVLQRNGQTETVIVTTDLPWSDDQCPYTFFYSDIQEAGEEVTYTFTTDSLRIMFLGPAMVEYRKR